MFVAQKERKRRMHTSEEMDDEAASSADSDTEVMVAAKSRPKRVKVDGMWASSILFLSQSL